MNKTVQHIIIPIKKFFELETASSILMLAAMGLALICANSPLSEWYLSFTNKNIGFSISSFTLEKSVLHWVNDGLMAIFFLLVGLEIKQEFVHGQLSTPAQAMLPVVAAAGGAMLPAIIYALINSGENGIIRGWGVPMATDIAFAIGLLALLGNRVPSGLKIFLTSLAVADDLMAVIVIALFYTDTIVVSYLLWSAAAVIGMTFLNRRNCGFIIPYLILGVVLWYCLLHAGIHASIAGVATAMFVPCSAGDISGLSKSPLARLGNKLQGFSSFIILPIFAFVNMGLTFSMEGTGAEAFYISAGIAAGLIIGKPVGIFGTVALLKKFIHIPLPSGVNMKHILGAGMLGGVGLTMSIFISTLAFNHADQNISKISILVASSFSGIIGLIYLKKIHKKTAD